MPLFRWRPFWCRIPGREALVDILTYGVCHLDLHYKQGGIGDEFPYLFGHEALV